jgi:uncharacterized protein
MRTLRLLLNLCYTFTMFPTANEINALHKKHAPSERVFALVWTHSLIVKEISESIMNTKELTINKELVLAGALIHDIGAYKLITANGEFDGPNYIRHGIYGYDMLQAENYPEDLCKIATHHTGVGITKDDVIKQKLPLPLSDYVAETTEEKLIMYADKFHSKTPKFNTFDSYATYIKKYGEDKVEKFQELADLFGIPKLEKLAETYNHPIQ